MCVRGQGSGRERERERERERLTLDEMSRCVSKFIKLGMFDE